ncbi:hypothetical protein EON67_09505 [archaeon]|nr:MAG: hypothetical protein EON67_09505 [archaeon]
MHTVRKLFPKFDYTWLADEIRDFLPNELDFLKEAANCKRAGDMFAGRTDVVVPRIYDHLSSSRVLVMSFENGSYANDVAAIKAAGLKNADVAALVSTVFSEQIFVHGLVHCDPHAANMLIRRGPDAKPQLVLLDHGTYRCVSHCFAVTAPAM